MPELYSSNFQVYPIHRLLRGVTLAGNPLQGFLWNFLFRRQHFYSFAQEVIFVVEKYQRHKAILSPPRNLLLGGVDC